MTAVGTDRGIISYHVQLAVFHARYTLNLLHPLMAYNNHLACVQATPQAAGNNKPSRLEGRCHALAGYPTNQ